MPETVKQVICPVCHHTVEVKNLVPFVEKKALTPKQVQQSVDEFIETSPLHQALKNKTLKKAR